ncbi:transglycosylase SLT domain-containing protein [bacterium]|nr:transglycosylase SLT domain-containing protein [bacterium]
MCKKVTFLLFIVFLLVNPQIWGNSTYDGLIHKYAGIYGLDPHLVKGLVKTESDFNPSAVSHKGAIGLCQIMPATGKGMGYSVKDLYKPAKNIEACCRFLSYLGKKASKYGYSAEYRIKKMLQGYYAGPAHLKKKHIDLYHMVYVSKVLKNAAYFTRTGHFFTKTAKSPGASTRLKMSEKRIKPELQRIYFKTNYYLKGNKRPLPETDFNYFEKMDQEFENILDQQRDSFNEVVAQAHEALNAKPSSENKIQRKDTVKSTEEVKTEPQSSIGASALTEFRDQITRVLEKDEVRIYFKNDDVKKRFLELPLDAKLKVLHASPVRRK